MKWVGMAIAMVILAGILLLALALLTDFADIPCQDGIWDKARHTCVPT